MNTLYVFKASWCGPCGRYAPTVDEAEPELKDLGVTVQRVSLDEKDEDKKLEAETLAAKYNVRSIPMTVYASNHGDVTLMGVQTKDAILNTVKSKLMGL